MGIVQLISLGLPMKILTQGSSLLNQLSKNLLWPRFLRIEGKVSARIDDVSIYDKCKTVADSVWTDIESSVVEFLSTV